MESFAFPDKIKMNIFKPLLVPIFARCQFFGGMAFKSYTFWARLIIWKSKLWPSLGGIWKDLASRKVHKNTYQVF